MTVARFPKTPVSLALACAALAIGLVGCASTDENFIDISSHTYEQAMRDIAACNALAEENSAAFKAARQPRNSDALGALVTDQPPPPPVIPAKAAKPQKPEEVVASMEHDMLQCMEGRGYEVTYAEKKSEG